MCQKTTTQDTPSAALDVAPDRGDAGGRREPGPGVRQRSRLREWAWHGPEPARPRPLGDWALPAAALALLLESLLGRGGTHVLLAVAVAVGVLAGRPVRWRPALGLSLVALLANDLWLPGLHVSGTFGPAGLVRLAAYLLEGMLIGSLALGLEGAQRRTEAARRAGTAATRGE